MKKRQDYINIQRRLVRLLREDHINQQLSFWPEPKYTNQTLAEKLGVNERTIRRHKQNISTYQWRKIQTEALQDRWNKVFSQMSA